MSSNGLASLGAMLRIVLLIFVGTSALVVLLQLAALAIPELLFGNNPAFALAMGGLSIIWVLLFLVSIVLVGIWVYMAHKSLHESGVQGLNYQPAWAAASFYIPFVNLYVPFASTRELYNRSHGESDWHASIAAGDVTSWAAFNWASLLMFCVLVGYFAVDSIEFVHVVMPMWGWIGLTMLLYLFMAGSAWYLAQIVTKVTAAQVNGVHQSQSDVFA